MARFEMSDGMIVDTDKASGEWNEKRRFDGRNHVSVVTGDQWVHETLYRSRRGRYYIVTSSQWQGSKDSAEWVSREEAARWLMLCDRKLPEDLEELADSLID